MSIQSNKMTRSRLVDVGVHTRNRQPVTWPEILDEVHEIDALQKLRARRTVHCVSPLRIIIHIELLLIT